MDAGNALRMGRSANFAALRRKVKNRGGLAKWTAAALGANLGLTNVLPLKESP